MKKAKFQILGIETKLSPLKSYSDDGFQNDMGEYLKKIGLKSWFPFSDKVMKHVSKNLGGVCTTSIPFSFRPKVHIGYLNTGNDFHNTLIRAHEETHALHRVGKIKLLEDKILERYGIKMNLEELDGEAMAHIGSFYVLAQYSCFSFLTFDDYVEKVVKVPDEKKLKETYDLFKEANKRLNTRT